MKCPNCSFMNPDRSVMCKICGYEFDTHPSKKGSHNSDHVVSSKEDSEIEVTFDTLFGVRSNPRKIKNPLDKSKDKKRGFDVNDENLEPYEDLDVIEKSSVLNAPKFDSPAFDSQAFDSQEPSSENQSSELDAFDAFQSNNPTREDSVEENSGHIHASSVLRPHIPLYEYDTDEFDNHPEPEVSNDVTEEAVTLDKNGDVIDIELVKTGEVQNDFYTLDEDILDEDVQKTNNRKITIILLIIVVLLIALVFAFTSSKFKFNPFAPNPGPESNISKPVDNTSAESNNPQTDEVINTSPNDTVNAFFNELPEYVNDNSISFSMHFKTPQSALEILTAFKNKGHIDKIEYDISDTTLNDDNTATVNVISSIERTNENKHLISQDIWQFVLILGDDDTWLIQDLSLNNQDTTTSEPDPTTTTNTTNTLTPPKETSPTEASTTTSTTPIKPEGFVTSGGFKGGIITDGQDISGIRYGNHDQFERLVIDLTEWQNKNADGSAVNVKEACHYEATISEDGLEVQMVLSGVRAASAVSPVFLNTSNIKSVDIYYPSDDSSIGLSIKLKKPSSFKVFPLKEPGRIVIDIMPES